MSLATRCTACGTIFRVVQDQLRVSEGWVRCGRCAEVFDAREQLFDIDREAPPPWPAPARDVDIQAEAELAEQPEAIQVQEPTPRGDDMTWAMPREDTAAHANTQAGMTSHADVDVDVAFTPETPLPGEVDEPAQRSGRREPYWVEDGAAAQDPPPSTSSTTPIAPLSEPEETTAAASASQGTGEPESSPVLSAGFLRQAEVASRWQSRRVRATLAMLALLLTGLLSVQFTLQYRDALQALFPPATPLLQAFCSAAGCELKAWRRIDALTVENSALTVAGNGNNYKLRINLHNKAAYAVALPWVDLSLTDSNGALVARRMLPPSDFNLSMGGSIGAHGEESLQIVFSTGAQRVSGYSIEIFHP